LSKDQIIGLLILIGSAAGIIIYGLLISYYPTIVLQLTAFLAVAAVLAILGWIGWTMSTTPPPTPIEEEKVVETASSTPEAVQEKKE
jgi:predicted DNA-binding transcriptional regulator